DAARVDRSGLLRRSIRGGQIALPRPRRHSRLLYAYGELVYAVIELLRREAEHVLTVQLLRDAREGRREVAGFLQLEIAAAGFVRDPLQAAIRLAADHPLAVEVVALQADRVDHHVLGARPIDHRPQAHVA